MNSNTYNVTLERLVRGEKSDLVAHRTSTVTGVTLDLPCPGQSFVMYAASLTPENDMRLVTTSPVKGVTFSNKPGGGYDTATFRTVSGSEYKLTIHSVNQLETVNAEDLPTVRA